MYEWAPSIEKITYTTIILELHYNLLILSLISVIGANRTYEKLLITFLWYYLPICRQGRYNVLTILLWQFLHISWSFNLLATASNKKEIKELKLIGHKENLRLIMLIRVVGQHIIQIKVKSDWLNWFIGDRKE